ncbi:DUF5689 domain-containing protein [Epilithonimonas pallida]|uniref:DUF5689 domain-containing protein n=2 Tax=Bacteria TaxID=2 RepID=A0ABY1QZ31_9FLAO|nr:DUF5689 domain-containing protein [Epilithonimonas pallida]SMP90191.1 hypothetical protein SAMN05421679_102214 [Epilithonimonas pallida]
MNIKNILKISFGAAALVATQVSCVQDDNWDAPEITCTNKWDAPTKTMAEVVAMANVLPASTYSDGNPKQLPADDPNVAGDEIIFDAYVVSSDAGGNFYKTISIQDKPENPTVGLSIGINKSMNYVDFPVGAHIRIKANGMVIGKSFNTMQLGVKDPNYPLGRIPESIIGRYISGVCSGNGLEIVDIVPTVVTINQLTSSTTGDKYLNTLVKVKNVQFSDSQIGLALMATDISGAFIDTDRTITDGTGSTAIRTDGFFKATSYRIPNKSGEITFVSSKYNANYQGIIRGTSDINLTNELPAKLLVEGFDNSSYTTNGWTVVNKTGTQTWGFTTFGNPAPSAYINGGTSGANEDWLISKELSLEGYTNSSLAFDTWRNFTATGSSLTVYVTDNYTGDPSTTTWTSIPATIATSNVFVNSGVQSLNAFAGKKIRIAFKYVNAAGSAYAYELDNVIVRATK